MRDVERIQTVVIGAGQAGLATGYHLQRLGVPFVILDAHERVGDNWRTRWDSLRLFTPARYNSIDGMAFPALATSFPTKDEMAAYLERYAAHFRLPVRTGVTVRRVTRSGGGFLLETSRGTIEAASVVVAMANFQQPRIPLFATELDPAIGQLHSKSYRSPSQLRDGSVLVVGAGNSGAEIAIELVRGGRRVIVAGSPPGEVPFRLDTFIGRHVVGPLVFRLVFHRVLSLATAIGRRAQTRLLARAAPLIRVKEHDLVAAGVERAPRVAGVRDGRPLLADGRELDVANVVWCTGFDPGFSWIELPAFAPDGRPLERRGIVASEPGLFFVGLHYQYALSSAMVQGASRDARHVAEVIARSAVSARNNRGNGATGAQVTNERTRVTRGVGAA